MTKSESLRQQLRDNILLDEAEALQLLCDNSQLSKTDRAQITDTAKALITSIRTNSEPQLTESFLAQYELSTEEGIALMCLAEALLRVPDTETVDALIHDKIVPADWGKHLGQSSSSLVNASTWALMLTGKVIADDEAAPGLVASLRGAIKRLGEPVIRTAVNQAIRELGNQFVLGQTIKEAIGKASESPEYTFSYDMLGEAARTEADAKRYHLAYSRAISTLGDNCKFATVAENPGISIKLSALHPRYEFAQREDVMVDLVARTRSLAMLAQSANMGFNIDAEEADRLDLSLDVIEAVLAEPSLAGWEGFGIVVQAYSKRAPWLLDTLYDMAERLDRRIMVRLVKGAYWDYEVKQAQVQGLPGFPVFTRKCNTDVSYIACAKQLFAMSDRIYPQFATHNAHSVAAILHLANVEQANGKQQATGTPHSHFEFQRLHGMGDSLHSKVIQQYNTRCRIYAPVGAHEDLLAYLVRRLLENGANSSFVNQIIDESISVDEVAADPFHLVENSDNPSHPAVKFAPALFSPNRKNSKGVWLSDPVQYQKLDQTRSKFATQQWQIPAPHGMSTNTVRNPANTDDVVGSWPDTTNEETAKEKANSAIKAARGAFKAWNEKGFEHRNAILHRCADALEANTGELCSLLAREAGKTLPDCIAEIREAVDFLHYYAVRSKELSTSHNVRGRGVFVCISPWNFPLAIFSGQIAAALACGNTVIAKPAEQTSLIAERVINLFHNTGIPPEALQLLAGDGATIGTALTGSPNIAGVCFTGSTTTAQIINRNIANNGNPSAVLIAETGGLNAMIVDSSALPEQVVTSVIESAFQSAGQRCSALRMLYVQEDIFDKFLLMLQGAMDLLNVGDPWKLSTDIGPIIDNEAHQSISDYISANKNNVLHTGKLSPLQNGHFLSPTLVKVGGIADLEREIFGPVLHIASYKAGDFFKVIDDINASGYGLTFGLHTRVDERVQDAVNAIDAGNIYINRNQIGAIVESQPFGGKNLSGTGPKAGGPHYLLRFLELDEEANEASTIHIKSDIKSDTTPPLLADTKTTIADLPDELAFCTAEISNALALAGSHYHPTIDLPGPTGESNRLSMEPAGRIVCVHSNDEALWIAQAVQCISLGNTVTMIGKEASARLQQLSQWLDEATTQKLRAIDASIDDSNAIEILATNDIAAVVTQNDSETVRHLRKLLSARDGAIVPISTSLFDISPLVDEKSLCIDTTAAGGNASLLAAAS